MVKPGTTLEIPTLGMQARFLQTGRASGGHMLRIEWTVQPGGGREALAHVHPRDDERFEIKSGQAGYQVGKRVLQARAGDDLLLPRAEPHVHPWNAGSDPLVFIQTITFEKPRIEALERVEAFFETLSVLSKQGKIDRSGKPRNLLQLAVLLRTLQPETYVAGLPIGLQNVMFGGLGWLGGRAGYKTLSSG